MSVKSISIFFIVAFFTLFWGCVVPDWLNNNPNDKNSVDNEITKYGSISLNLSNQTNKPVITERVDSLFGLGILPERSLVVSSIAKIRITIYATNLQTPIVKTASLTNGGATVTIDNIPVGTNRIIVVEGQSSDGSFIADAKMSAVFDVSEGNNSVTVNRETTPLGNIFIELFVSGKLDYIKNIDASALATFLENIKINLNITSFFIDSAKIATAIITNNGSIPSDSNNTEYKMAIGSLTFTFSGDVPPNTTVGMDDPASQDIKITSATTYTLENILPGSNRYLIVRVGGAISNIYSVGDILLGVNTFNPLVTKGIPITLNIAGTPYNDGLITKIPNPAFSGSTSNNYIVKISINGAQTIVASDSSGNWSYTPSSLTPGVNNISVYSYPDDSVSSTTIPYVGTLQSITLEKSVIYDNTPPVITTDLQDNAEVTNNFILTGTFTDNYEVSSSDFTIKLIDSSNTGLFSYTISIGAGGGWSFNGWGSYLTNGQQYTIHISGTDLAGNQASITIPFKVEDQYIITYTPNGGTASGPPGYTPSILPIALYPATRDGYIFGGWYEDPGFSGTPISVIPIGTARNITLYAKWIYDFASMPYRDMVNVTGDVYIQEDPDDGEYFHHIISNFKIGKYEVTYELWYIVYQWALSHNYTFQNMGREGSDGAYGNAPTSDKYKPVTNINWRDAMVWCNAYSEMVGLDPVYTYMSAPIRDSKDANATACDNVTSGWINNGYRLPTEGEWQFAASYIDTTYWTLSTYASGAATSSGQDDVAWYNANSGGKTHEVGTKNANALGIYDMSGNVWEWCWDWYTDYPSGSQTNYRGPYTPVSGSEYRIKRGGSWYYGADSLQIGTRLGLENPGDANSDTGFRVAQKY